MRGRPREEGRPNSLRAFRSRTLRRRRTGLVLVLALAPAWARGTPPGSEPGGGATLGTPQAVHALVDKAIGKVYPALVRIHVVAVSYKDGREVKRESAGSGAVISADGYVITNHHVAGRSRRIRCTLSDKREVAASLVGTDPLSDIAVLKLQLPDGAASGLPYASFGDSEALRVGDQVLAMGSPRAISQSVTLGIVSNVEMTFPRMFWPFTFKLDGEETGSVVKWIGHDAQIHPGNSGGPLVNLEGEIVGINEISFGLGGAIPGNLARSVAEQIIATGEVRRSWLGLAVQPRLKAGSAERGVLIGGVVAGSPAEKAGLRPGDLLLSFQGQALDIRYPEELPEFNRLLLGTPIGTRVELVYLRDGREHRVSVVTVARGQAQGEEAELKAWGVAVQDLTLLAAKELDREPHSGVLVSSVRPGSPASEAKPALQPNDILVEVAGRPVRTVDDLLEASRGAGNEGAEPAPLLVGFERKAEKLLTVVRVGDGEGQDRSAEARKAWLSAASQVVTPDLAEALGLPGRTGVRLSQVYAGGNAEAAGLQVGDVVLKLDGTPIPATQPEDVEVFPAMVRQYPIGKSVGLEVVRAGRTMVVDVVLAASPRSTRELVEYRDSHFDFSARDLTFMDRVQENLDQAQDGALVTSVDTGGWAALAQLAVGDIVLSVDGEKIASAADLEGRMGRIARERPGRVVFFVRRGVQTLFVELEPAWPPA